MFLSRNRVFSKPAAILIFPVVLLIAGNPAVFGQSGMPAEAANYIYMVVFFEVPDTITPTLHFSVGHGGLNTATPSVNNPDG